MDLGARRMLHAIGWRTAFLVTQAGASFAVFVALAHLLPAREYAAAAVAQGTLVIAQAIGDFGLSQAAISLLPARIAAAPARAAELLRGAASAYFGCAIAALVLAAATTVFLPDATVGPVLAIAPAAALGVLVSGADGLLRAQGEVRRPVGLVAMSRAGMLLAIPAAAVTDTAIGACVAISIGTAMGSLPAVGEVGRAVRRGPAVPGATRDFVTGAVPLGLGQLFTQAVGRANTLLIGSLASLRAAAAFEASWRLFQLGQYVVGAVATATSPMIGSALGSGRTAQAERAILRLAGALLAAGALVGGVLLAVREPLADALFDELGGVVAGAMVPLILVTPLAFLGFFAAIVLASADEFRTDVTIGAAIGAVVNVVSLVAFTERSAAGACLAGALGVAAANVYLVARLLAFRRVLTGRRQAPMQPAPHDA